MKHSITLDFCELVFYEGYSIITINEGVLINESVSLQITQILVEYFKDNPFIYITNRINSYSIDPRVYELTSLLENLHTFVIVSNNTSHAHNAEVEQIFLKKPIKIFDELDDAVEWTKDTINTLNSNALKFK
ncbi:hypothetical protein [Lacinutrix salivirga]